MSRANSATSGWAAGKVLRSEWRLFDYPGATSIRNMTNLQDFIAEIRAAAWRTGGSRFNAARRLQRRDKLGALSIAAFSAIAIVITIVQKVYGITTGTPVDDYLTALSLCIGLFVIVISIAEWGMGGSVKAESLHKSAMELGAFQRKLAQVLAEVKDGRALQSDEAKELRDEHERITERCPYNHEPLDHDLFLVQQRFSSEYEKLFKRAPPNFVRATWIRILSVLGVIGYFGAFWLVIGIVMLMTPWG